MFQWSHDPHKDCNSSTACCISMGAWMPTKLNVEKQNAWWHEGRGTIINVITAWSCCYFLWMLAVVGLACMRMWWNEWIWRWTACQLSKILKSFDTALLKLLYCVWWPSPRLSPPTASSSFCCLQSAPLSFLCSPTHDVCVCVCISPSLRSNFLSLKTQKHSLIFFGVFALFSACVFHTWMLVSNRWSAVLCVCLVRMKW